MKSKCFPAISLLLLFFLLMTGCSPKSSKSSDHVKLTDYQQALADSFYDNREIWEFKKDDTKVLRCLQLQLCYYEENVRVRCGYGWITSSDLVTFSVTEGLGFIVTEDDVILYGETTMPHPGPRLPGATLTGEPAIARYYINANDEKSKREIIEDLFSNLE